MALRVKLYVGIRPDHKREIFRAIGTPTQETHGRHYAAVIGPFRTRRGAEVMRTAQSNPNCQCVADAERLGRLRAAHPTLITKGAKAP